MKRSKSTPEKTPGSPKQPRTSKPNQYIVPRMLALSEQEDLRPEVAQFMEKHKGRFKDLALKRKPQAKPK